MQEVSLDDLLKVFDEVDEDETGFAPRLDLRTRVDDYIPRNARVQELSDTIRALDVMILERDDYIEIVEEWLRGGKQSEAPASEPEAAPAATEVACSIEFHSILIGCSYVFVGFWTGVPSCCF